MKYAVNLSNKHLIPFVTFFSFFFVLVMVNEEDKELDLLLLEDGNLDDWPLVEDGDWFLVNVFHQKVYLDTRNTNFQTYVKLLLVNWFSSSMQTINYVHYLYFCVLFFFFFDTGDSVLNDVSSVLSDDEDTWHLKRQYMINIKRCFLC